MLERKKFFKTLVWILLTVSFPTSANAQNGILALPSEGSYNGFNSHLNVVECTNFGSEAASVRLSLFRHTGAFISSGDYVISPNGTVHVILNNFADANGLGITNDIGIYRLEDIGSTFDIKLSCLTAFYRMQPGNSSPEYAFSVPVREKQVNKTSGLYNSIDPAGTGVPTQNWLTIFHPNQSGNFSATVNLYNQDGSLRSSVPVSLGAGQRTDIPLAHPQGQSTGIYEIIPADSTSYESFLARYHTTDGSNYNFAFSQLSTKGSCNETLSASTMGNAVNWLEMGNPNSTAKTLTVEILDRFGGLTHTEQKTVQPYGQENLYLNPHIDPSGSGNVGSVRVTCNSQADDMLIQSAFYGRPNNATTQVSWAYVSQALGAPTASANDILVASVNTFLGAANWAKVANAADVGAPTQFYVYSEQGAQLSSNQSSIASLGSTDFGAHEPSGYDKVGTLALGSSLSPTSLRGELIRVYLDSAGNILEIMPTPMAMISNGLTCLNGGCNQGEFAGNVISLSPYKEDLTPAEVDHLLDKVALGGDKNLRAIGVSQGRSALTNALLNYTVPASVEAQAMLMAEDEFSSSGTRWSTSAAQNYWLTHLRYGNPLKEKMALVLHDHLATNLTSYSGSSRRHHWIPEHLSLLRNNALGSFQTFVLDLFWDGPNNYELNLKDNHCGLTNDEGDEKCNENYPREFAELLTLGQTNPETGLANYTETDVIQPFSRFLSGFTALDHYQQPATYIAWSPNLHYSGTSTVFAGKPWQTTAAFNYEDFALYMLQVNTDSSRYIARTLIQRLANIDPTPTMVSQIAAQLRATDYNLANAVGTIINSSAMFSQEARRTCVNSPVEILIRFMRRLDLPLANSSNDDLYRRVREYMYDTGQPLLDPPTVFGFGGCFGHTGNTNGEGFAAPQRLLNGSLRRIVYVLNELDDVVQDGAAQGFTWNSLLPNANPQPAQIVDHLASKLTINLTSSQRQSIINYLSTRYSYVGDPTADVITWDSADSQFDSLVRLKVGGGLLSILYTHPDNYLR